MCTLYCGWKFAHESVHLSVFEKSEKNWKQSKPIISSFRNRDSVQSLNGIVRGIFKNMEKCYNNKGQKIKIYICRMIFIVWKQRNKGRKKSWKKIYQNGIALGYQLLFFPALLYFLICYTMNKNYSCRSAWLGQLWSLRLHLRVVSSSSMFGVEIT